MEGWIRLCDGPGDDEVLFGRSFGSHAIIAAVHEWQEHHSLCTGDEGSIEDYSKTITMTVVPDSVFKLMVQWAE